MPRKFLSSLDQGSLDRPRHKGSDKLNRFYCFVHERRHERPAVRWALPMITKSKFRNSESKPSFFIALYISCSVLIEFSQNEIAISQRSDLLIIEDQLRPIFFDAFTPNLPLRNVFKNYAIWFADQSEYSTDWKPKSENETKLNNQILQIQDELDKTKIEKNNAEDNIIKLTRQNQNEMLSGQLLSKIFQEIFMVFLNSKFLHYYFAFFSLHDFNS